MNDFEGPPVERLDRHSICYPRTADFTEDCTDDLLRCSGSLWIIGIDLGLDVEAHVLDIRRPFEKLSQLQQPVSLGYLLIGELRQGQVAFDRGQLLPSQIVDLHANVGEGLVVILRRIGISTLLRFEHEVMPHHRRSVRGEHDIQLQGGYAEPDRVLVCGPRGLGEFTAPAPMRLQVKAFYRRWQRHMPLGLARLGLSTGGGAPGHRKCKQRSTAPDGQRPTANLSAHGLSFLPREGFSSLAPSSRIPRPFAYRDSILQVRLTPSPSDSC